MPEVSRHPGERGCARIPLVRNRRCVRCLRCVRVGRKAHGGIHEPYVLYTARPDTHYTIPPRILSCYRWFHPRHRIVYDRLPRRRAALRGHLVQRILPTSVRRLTSHPVQLYAAAVGWSVHDSPWLRASPAPLVWRDLPPVQKSADVGSSDCSLRAAHEGAHPSQASAEQDSMNAHRDQR